MEKLKEVFNIYQEQKIKNNIKILKTLHELKLLSQTLLCVIYVIFNNYILQI